MIINKENRTTPFQQGELKIKRKFFVWALIVFLLSLAWCDSSLFDREASEEYKKNHPSAFQVNAFVRDISPDNQKLLFQYGSPFWSKLGTYDISTGRINLIHVPLENKINYTPYFSPDGKEIVFSGARERDYGENIYIMNSDGSGLRQITNNPKGKSNNIQYASSPSFSPDGKRIIFLRSHRERKRAYPLGGEMYSDWDIYELDIETAVERRLTNYNFYETSWPYYMADGKRFIFSGEGPYNPTGKGPKDFKEYEEQYQKNSIFIMDGKNNELKPAVVNGSHSYRPHVSGKDTILFISRTNEMDELTGAEDIQDLFLHKSGKVTRLTKLNAYITWARISRDGSTIIFAKKSDRLSNDESEWMMKNDGSGLREIKIPIDLLKK